MTESKPEINIQDTLSSQFKTLFEELSSISKRTKDLHENLKSIQKTSCKQAEKFSKKKKT